MDFFFSVIIPSYNEEKLLPRLLKALSNQTFKNFEVILIDANSNDKTVSEAKRFSKSLNLSIFSINEKNVSSSRNLGASKARGEYLFFVDADNYILPSFLEKMEIILKRNYQMVIPSITPDSKNLYYKLAYQTANLFVWIAWKLRLSFSTGGNMIVKRDVFEKLGGFDNKIFVGEDHDIVKRARKAGFKMTFISKPKLVFSVRRLEKEGGVMLLKYFMSTLYIVLFGKITRKMYNYEMGGEYFEEKNKII